MSRAERGGERQQRDQVVRGLSVYRLLPSLRRRLAKSMGEGLAVAGRLVPVESDAAAKDDELLPLSSTVDLGLEGMMRARHHRYLPPHHEELVSWTSPATPPTTSWTCPSRRP